MSLAPTTYRIMTEAVRIFRDGRKHVKKLDVTDDVLSTLRVEETKTLIPHLVQFGLDDFTFMGRPVHIHAPGELDAPGWQWRT